MRSLKAFTIDIVRKPPMIFPLVALFHILLLLWTIWDDRKEPLDIVWLQILWLAAYTFFWLIACDLRKWGAIGYFVLTLLNLSLYLAAKNHKVSQEYVSNMFILDVLFSFSLIFFYKKFR